MGVKVALEHRTIYTFDRLVEVHPHVVRLRPAPHSRTKIDAYSLRVTPETHFVNWQQDAFGNFLARLVFLEPTRELSITVGLIADLEVINPFDFFVEDYAEYAGFGYPPELTADLEPYLRRVDEADPGSGPGRLVRQWAADHRWPEERIRTIDFLVRLNQALCSDVGYSVRMEPGVQTPDHTLSTAIGSCRDSAWLLVSVLRELGLAARFVSGYLVQLAADVESLDGPSGPAADFTDLHAWTEVYLPGAGWVGLDPTSGLFAGEGHIPLAATPAPNTSAAITGSTGPCRSTLEFANIVRRVHEDPRVTLPYNDSQWASIVAAGAKLDSRAAEADIRLTVGGEPTFVSIDDQTAKEWTVDADGPQKRERADDLAARLKRIYAPAGLVHRAQGKWYPGEPLPRWQIALYWRTDGGPLWSDPSLLADPWSPHQTRDTDAGTAHQFLDTLAESLGLPRSQVRPVFEDSLARLAAAVRLPAGHPVEVDLVPDTPDARADLLAELDGAVTDPAGYLLPLHHADEGWASADWRLRRGRIVLLAGDSPAGLRLPLDAIDWSPPPPENPADPLAPRPPLRSSGAPEAPVPVVPAAKMPVTALVAEVRDGLLYVFLPPTEDLEHFVDLVARIEEAAATLDQPVVVEGYGPPPDPRLQALTITPDPGVIEVNVQPTGSFAEQTELLETLYGQARLARLSTESFDVDGTHGGTGGGNHITLGGATPADSPLLRRPDLLVSMLTYWQRHPALSYLFAGRFVGTTSQAPRADEGREDALYELEIAFAELARLGADAAPPWAVDRALRHLLTDITGNTHRAEFCIDKLYSPDSARGRLGLLELRGFEMPPHPQMALVQSLLVRGLVAWFWEQPLRAPLLRHGANLHGRYLLPHFVTADIAEVAADLRAAGIDFETSWLDPFTEFRFPRIGTAVVAGAEIELRGAIEPWRTLGEEAAGTGTARYVDSSVERLQVRLVGADRDRYVLTCNGFPVPLLATDQPDVQVAGVRFRAWQPPSSLHPTLTVDGPLVFDLVDAATGLSHGGCTYHVAHPGGRSYDVPPVNAVEAESRRNGRFTATGHQAAPVHLSDLREKIARSHVDLGAPGILDLRRARTVQTGTG
ncbi:DUF2126 domain-containing protein [Skermania piniformis]|uniref:Transglutaminase family protein n=1 Tax=Skermania pinensis TaxID=39122 RepID=A0ABX8S8K9_9ACTN|nr:transglutaminase family protein [Skermania piniformis]QXQ14152.1 transglutaminase family protein [Skermania piniformis]